jgi:hypothetical protein
MYKKYPFSFDRQNPLYRSSAICRPHIYLLFCLSVYLSIWYGICLSVYLSGWTRGFDLDLIWSRERDRWHLNQNNIKGNCSEPRQASWHGTGTFTNTGQWNEVKKEGCGVDQWLARSAIRYVPCSNLGWAPWGVSSLRIREVDIIERPSVQ